MSMIAVHQSESETETPRRKQCSNSTAGRPAYILKTQQMYKAVVKQTEFY